MAKKEDSRKSVFDIKGIEIVCEGDPNAIRFFKFVDNASEFESMFVRRAIMEELKSTRFMVTGKLLGDMWRYSSEDMFVFSRMIRILPPEILSMLRMVGDGLEPIKEMMPEILEQIELSLEQKKWREKFGQVQKMMKYIK